MVVLGGGALSYERGTDEEDGVVRGCLSKATGIYRHPQHDTRGLGGLRDSVAARGLDGHRE